MRAKDDGQRYRLRLGDGTVLSVDYESLSTWVEDAGAMVQVVGSQRWSPLKPFLAAEQAAARRAQRESKDRAALPLVYPKPRAEEAPRPPNPAPSDPLPILPPGQPPGVQVLADEPTVPREKPAPQPSAPKDDAGVRVRVGQPVAMPLTRDRDEDQPLDEPYPAPAYAVPRERAGGLPSGAGGGPARSGRLPEPVLHAVSVVGSFLSRLLNPLSRLDQGLPLVPDEPAPWQDSLSPVSTAPRPAAAARAAAALGVLREALDRVKARLQALCVAALAWVYGLTRRLGHPIAPDRPSPAVPADEPAAPSRPFRPASESPQPPLPISQLPVLRLAEMDEPKATEDDHAEEAYEGEGSFEVAWLWTKRIVAVTLLGAGGIFVASSWETWFPKAERLGSRAISEIDQFAQSRLDIQRQERALKEAIERLPHLPPATIERLLSGSPTRALEPAEVFRLAGAAADRGLSALTEGEAEELRALNRALIETLPAADRERVQQYDRARERRATFSFEQRDALAAFARGARALPPQSLERLQALSAKAIAAGLASSTEAASDRDGAR
jgi:hypothetical protein